MRQKDEEWALFWCGLLHEVIFGEIEVAEVNRHLKNISRNTYRFPDGKLRKPSISTLRRKLQQYRTGGFDALARKRRNDRGKPRSVAQEIIDRAVELKRDQPMRSDETINRFLKSEYGITIPPSTLYRHLKRAGATKMKLGVVKKKVRRRWTRERSNELWIGDFEEGPYVLVDDEVLPTYLSLFIDCHSRYVVEGRYYLRQTKDVLIDSLLRAWTTHGVSQELYLDNAKVYHSNALKAAAYRLTINLIHRTAGDPSPGGLVERMFGTTQSQFEAEVRAGEILTLDKLNKAFSAYLVVSYHERKHSETGEPPRQRYEAGLKSPRFVDMEVAARCFMDEVVRKVDPDFSDIRLHKKFYKVDPRFRNDKVRVRYDPYSSMEIVLLYSLEEDDTYLGKGILHHRDKDATNTTPPQSRKPKNDYLGLLISQHEEQLKARAHGIDYRKAISQREWPFLAFIRALARLMGRKGALSAFNAGELELLKKLYQRYPELNETILVQAFEQAEVHTIPHLAHQLQNLKKRKEK